MQTIKTTNALPEGIRPLHAAEIDDVSGANSLIFGGWVAGWFYVGYKIRTWLF